MLLLVLFPVAWLAPLARAQLLPLFGSSEISILSGVIALSRSDPLLCAVVTFFAMLLPYGKLFALLGAQFGQVASPRRWVKVLGMIGKLSMTDVFLVAMYIVVVKGVGIGEVTPAWGLYLFTALVLISIWATWVTERALRRAPGDEARGS